MDQQSTKDTTVAGAMLLQVNDSLVPFRAENFTEGQRIHRRSGQGPPAPAPSSLELGQPIGLVTRQNTWENYMGQPMEQIMPDMCVLTATTACLEAVHRFEYEKVHGKGAFRWRARPPLQLVIECLRDRTWMAGEGANVGAVLTKIQQMGGVPATAAAAPSAPRVLLPLRSWQEHRWDADAGGLSPERVVELMDGHGPCVGVLWACPPYHDFDASRDDAAVYRGCGRGEDARRRSAERYGVDKVGSHAVVCVAYRCCRGGEEETHVLVRDNQDAAANGPQRWVHADELDTLYTMAVERLPPMHLGDR